MLFFSMMLPQNNTHQDWVNGFVLADSCLLVEAFLIPEVGGETNSALQDSHNAPHHPFVW